MMSSKRYHVILLIVVLLFWAWSGIKPRDTRLTWVLETLPFMIALPVILFTYKRFPLTNLTYTLIAIHAMILMLGGHYSYAKVPLGFWMEDWFGWTRNNYDKIGHFMQGFGPAIYAREHPRLRVESGSALYLSLCLWLFPHYTKFSNGWLPLPIRPILKPFLERRVTSGTHKATCFGV
jgi:uncharacterized membrane protein YjdF